MPNGSQQTALRKRQQIAKANRTMFLWVAGVSVVVGFSLVIAGFLLQKALFNERVLGEKSKTASTLVANNKAIDDLKDQIRVLNTNQALKDSMINGETEPVQVVLDALPSDANSAALGASLQKKFLSDSALRIETFVVDPIEGVESNSTADVEDAAPTDSTSTTLAPAITFRFSVSTEASHVDALKKLLVNIEKSIRPIDITKATVEAQGERLVLTVDGQSYYSPAKTVELKDKVVKP